MVAEVACAVQRNFDLNGTTTISGDGGRQSPVSGPVGCYIREFTA